MNDPQQDTFEELIQLGVINYRGDQHLDFDKAKQISSSTWNPQESNLWVAASSGNREAIVSLLEQNPKLADQTCGPFGWTPLLYLCYSRIRNERQDWYGTVKALLESGADPNGHFWISNSCKFTCLTGLIGEGEAGAKMWPPHAQAREIATLLLEAGADPNDSQGLYNSMFSGGIEWIELLLQYNWKASDPINWKTAKQMSTMDFLLAYACKKNQVDRVEILLGHGANPKTADYYENGSAVQLAGLRGNQEVLDLLAKAGADWVAPTTPCEKFLTAVANLDVDKVEELKQNASSEEFEKWIRSGESALCEQVELNRLAVVSLMLELGFPIGESLFTAAWNGHFQMARLLIEHGASVRQRDKSHRVTPIAFANRTGYTDLRDFMLNQNADVFDVISFGSVVRMEEVLVEDPFALERNFSEYVDNCPKLDAITPLTHAVMLGKAEHAELLIQLGADLQVRHPDGRNLAEIARQVVEEQSI